MRELPCGTVTLLFTDIEGSTRLLQELGRERYVRALSEHRRLLRQAFARHGGVEVEMQGDSFHFAFASAREAVAAAAEGQRALAAHAWEEEPIRVRIGLHSGEPLQAEGVYAGLDVHRAARVMAAAHGGQVLLSQATRELLAEVDLRDLGEHRLKDLIEPERLYQLGGGEFPPPKTLTGRATNLPAQPTALIGRERELSELITLQRGQARLVTVTGPGGIGKTRLALQAAAESLEDFPDGVWVVLLAPLTDPDLVVPTIAQTLGVREVGGEPLARTLGEYLRGRDLLLLLDNFEHVLDAAPAVGALLAAASGLRLFVTSREPLRLTGEREYLAPALNAEEALALFRERALAVKDDFAPEEDLPAIEEICNRLDRLPLAIELAAARINVLTPAALLARLGRRLQLLTSGRRDAPERQRTLRATIDWSYEQLAKQEQRLFARLAIFSGGSTLEAVETVCEADFDTLASLVDKSLVRRDGERFVMLETVREYALERLQQSDEEAVLSRRHAQTFRDVAELAERELAGPNERFWLDRLAAENANLSAALEWSVNAGEASIALRTSSALFHFWDERGRAAEGVLRLEQAVSLFGGTEEERGKALYALGALRAARGDYGPAEDAFAQAVRSARGEGEPRVLSRTLNGLGLALMHQGKLARAAEAFDEALALKHLLGDPQGIAILHNSLGSLAQRRGDLEEAAEHYAQSLGRFRQTGDERGVLICLDNLGGVEIAQGKLAEASAVLQEAMELAIRLGSLPSQAYVLGNLGRLALAEGNRRRAVELFLEALELFRRLDDGEGIALMLDALAAALVVDEPRSSLVFLRAAESLRVRLKIGLSAHLLAERNDILRRASEALPADQATAALARDITIEDAIRLAATSAPPAWLAGASLGQPGGR